MTAYIKRIRKGGKDQQSNTENYSDFILEKAKWPELFIPQISFTL